MPISNSLFFLDFIDVFRFKLVLFEKIHIIGCTYEEIVGYSNANVEFINSRLANKVYTKDPETPFNSVELIR